MTRHREWTSFRKFRTTTGGRSSRREKKSQTMTNTDFSCSLQPNFGYNALGLANEIRARSAQQVKTKMKTECCFSVGNDCERVCIHRLQTCSELSFNTYVGGFQSSLFVAFFFFLSERGFKCLQAFNRLYKH